MYIGFDVYDCGKCTNTAALETHKVRFEKPLDAQAHSLSCLCTSTTSL